MMENEPSGFMILLVVLAALSIFALALVLTYVAMEHKNVRRLDCRVCGQKLHAPGGHGDAYCGTGFCHRCHTKILREVNR